MRYFFLIVALLVLVVVSIAGLRGCKSPRRPLELFQGDMRHQPKVKPQAPSPFYSDRVGARIPPAGTVPLQAPAKLDYLHTGKIGDRWGDGMPITVDLAALERGRERYTINCQVCHGPLGNGGGITTRYGLNGVANLHQQKFRDMPDGEIFNTITNGKGLMGAYGYNVAVEDRWKIIAYVRALQRSQNARLEDAPEEDRPKLLQSKPPVPTSAPPSSTGAAPAAGASTNSVKATP